MYSLLSSAYSQLSKYNCQPSVAGGIPNVSFASRKRRTVDDELFVGGIVNRSRFERLYVGTVTNLGHCKTTHQLARGCIDQIFAMMRFCSEALNASDTQQGKAEAKKEYETALSLDQFDEKSECKLGSIAYGEGDLKSSFSHYSRAAQLQPDDPEAALGLAQTLVQMKEIQKAQALLEHAVQTDPTSAEAHFRLAALYREQGRVADAKQELEQYQKFKDMKESLKKIYQEMRLQPMKQESEGRDLQ